jgi:hypothetical protein
MAEGSERLKGFLREYLTGILGRRNTNGGPYRYWVANTDERGYIGIDTVMNAHVMRRSQTEHDRRQGAGYFRRVLEEVLREEPFEMDSTGTRWKMRVGGAAGGAAARTSAEIWARAGNLVRGRAPAPETGAEVNISESRLSSAAGEFIPGVGVQYNAWNARAPHTSAAAAFGERSVFVGQPNLRPVNASYEGGRRKRVVKKKTRKASGRGRGRRSKTRRN